MITVTEEARELFRSIDNPDGTILRLDPVATDQVKDETQIRLGIGEPKSDDQVVQHEGEDLLRIARPVSEALNGSTIDLVETLEGPALGIKPPEDNLPLTDGS
ncbi:MAG: iron-sulfur cluster assembly protein [Rubrobacteraceae bacterium]|jgi:iron-sulfur cluster assembly protein|nr:iron-sulfur cluster assembly protein [Rubrobacteraceae bacterium]